LQFFQLLSVPEATDALPSSSILIYNFKVDDFHTYHVGDNEVLVHNANYVEGDLDGITIIIRSMQGKHIS